MHTHDRMKLQHSISGTHARALWLALRGHHGRHGGGRGAMDDDDGMGGDGAGGRLTRGRKFGSDELQLMLLALLEERPSHGYELIKELDARSNGFYSPSPGMVYPALTYLEELDYATIEAHGNRKRYHLAEPGRLHLEANRDRVELLFAGLKHMARKMAWVKQALNDEAATDRAAVEADGWLPEFVAARRALKTALLRRTDASAAEQRRIAAVLERAASEILGDAAAPSRSI
ncbi:PadR family transcriptional regulator [Pollutimonas bauzanensis]|uniref:DNA-binding transcriptional regulator, PadR family n=1 Tax=Pollutimonas bauzanensis TaxID=658167 RepID=A0A1M5YT43_9BURK|nr:PadR family transcriptional regulator [Pollutimonas bauzanensis]SHI15232.1 DNA-binding transcriptional regulator, PadR family [Pollutimonas bauzanensis]